MLMTVRSLVACVHGERSVGAARSTPLPLRSDPSASSGGTDQEMLPGSRPISPIRADPGHCARGRVALVTRSWRFTIGVMALRIGVTPEPTLAMGEAARQVAQHAD